MKKKAHRKPARKPAKRPAGKLVRLQRPPLLAPRAVKAVLLKNGHAAPPSVALQRMNFDALVWVAIDGEYTIHWTANDPFGAGDIVIPQGEAVYASVNVFSQQGHYPYTLAVQQVRTLAAIAVGESAEMTYAAVEMSFGNPEVIIQ